VLLIPIALDNVYNDESGADVKEMIILVRRILTDKKQNI
jgi:hypothetical protein